MNCAKLVSMLVLAAMMSGVVWGMSYLPCPPLCKPTPTEPVNAPELDPLGGGAAIAILVGTVLLVREKIRRH